MLASFESRQAHGSLSGDEEVRILLERLAKTACAEAAAVYAGLSTPELAVAFGSVQFPGQAGSIDELERLDAARLQLDPEGKSVVAKRFVAGVALLVVDRGSENGDRAESALHAIESVFSLEWSRQRKLALSSRLSARHVERREKDLLSLSQKIHNELSQNITLIRLGLASVMRQVQDSDTRPKADLEELIEVAKQVSNSVIDISSNLRPPMIESIGPVLALRQEAKRFQASTGIPVECDLQEEAAALQGQTSMAVFRIAQECLANVGKHARAGRVRMKLSTDGSSAALTIEDDGCGFHPDQYSEALGLAEMSEQASLARGTILIESSPGSGTRVTAHFPSVALVVNRNRKESNEPDGN